VMVRCLAHRNGQKVRWLVWGVRFGLVSLPGDSNCEAAHSVGGSTVGVAERPALERMDGSGGKAYPTEEQRRVVEKDVVRSSYRHGAGR
jgi:hypothetical protein